MSILNDINTDEQDDDFEPGELDGKSLATAEGQQQSILADIDAEASDEENKSAATNTEQPTDAFDVFDEDSGNELFGKPLYSSTKENEAGYISASAEDDGPDLPPESFDSRMPTNNESSVIDFGDDGAAELLQTLSEDEQEVIRMAVAAGLSIEAAKIIMNLLTVQRLNIKDLESTCKDSIGLKPEKIIKLFYEKLAPKQMMGNPPNQGGVPSYAASQVRSESPTVGGIANSGNGSSFSGDGDKDKKNSRLNVSNNLKLLLGAGMTALKNRAADWNEERKIRARLKDFEAASTTLAGVVLLASRSVEDLTGNVDFVKAINGFEGASAKLIGTAKNDEDAEWIHKMILKRLEDLKVVAGTNIALTESLNNLADKIEERFNQVVALLKVALFGNKTADSEVNGDEEAAIKSPTMSAS